MPDFAAPPSSVDSHDIGQTRRDFLAETALFATAFFLGSCSERPKSTAPKSSFDALVTTLQANGFLVRESRFVGDKIVVLVSEGHSVVEEERTVAILQKLRQHFPYEVLGFEGGSGLLDGPQPNSITDGERQVRVVLQSQPELLLNEAELKAAKLNFTASKPDIGDLSPLMNQAGYKCFGIEPTFPLVEAELVEVITSFYARVKHRLEVGNFYILGVDEKFSPDAHAFFVAQEYLAQHYPDFEKFDLRTGIKAKVEGMPKPIDVIAKKQLVDIERLAAATTAWIHSHLSYSRNQPAAEEMARIMEEVGAKRGAIEFGLAHTITADSTQKGIQEYLAGKGISFIVIDPFPVTIKRSATELEVDLSAWPAKDN